MVVRYSLALENRDNKPTCRTYYFYTYFYNATDIRGTVREDELDYLTYTQRPVPYTLATRKLRDLARISELCETSEDWEDLLDKLEQTKDYIWNL